MGKRNGNRFFTDAEIQSLLRAVSAKARRGTMRDKADQALVLYAWATGCRAGEIASMSIDPSLPNHIDLGAGVVASARASGNPAASCRSTPPACGCCGATSAMSGPAPKCGRLRPSLSDADGQRLHRQHDEQENVAAADEIRVPGEDRPLLPTLPRPHSGPLRGPLLTRAGPALPGADAEADAASWNACKAGSAATHGLTAVSPSGERVSPLDRRMSGGRRRVRRVCSRGSA